MMKPARGNVLSKIWYAAVLGIARCSATTTLYLASRSAVSRPIDYSMMYSVVKTLNACSWLPSWKSDRMVRWVVLLLLDAQVV